MVLPLFAVLTYSATSPLSERLSVQDRVDRGVAGGEILAIPAPAGAQRDRRLAELETDGAAEAAAFDWLGHRGFPLGGNARTLSNLTAR
jgi:hypothetical protein